MCVCVYVCVRMCVCVSDIGNRSFERDSLKILERPGTVKKNSRPWKELIWAVVLENPGMGKMFHLYLPRIIKMSCLS